jgi:uncharacterized protein
MFRMTKHLILALSVALVFQAGIVDAVPIQTENKVEGEELWYGIIKTPKQWMRIVLHLNASGAKITGYGVSLDQASAKLPISDGSRVDGKWTLEFKGAGATFKGTESKDGKSIDDGRFTQGGGELSLKLQRIEKIPSMPANKVYRGELNAIIQKLQMQVRFIDNEKVDGKQLVLVDSLSQKTGSFVGTFEETDTQRVINVPVLSANWKSEKANDKDGVWTGSWSQGVLPLPLALKFETTPMDYAAFEKVRPQTPKAPFPYEIREVDWKNEAASHVQLSGTLLLPKAEDLRAAVVLLTGSGPQDRDESLADHKPFLIIADFLARRGVAVLRFDDRGVARSTGDFAAATTEDFTSDALSAWKYLASQVKLAPSKIGMLGHSEGSSFALSSAAKNPEIGFLILMAGAAWDGKRIVVEQAVLMAEKSGSSKTTLDALRHLLDKHCDLVLAKPDAEDFKKNTEKLVDQYIQVAEVPKDQIEPARAAMIARFLQLNGEWYRDFLVRDPSHLVPSLKLPIFALWGSLDLQVPAEGNRGTMQDALKKGTPHPLTQLEILQNANHLLQPCKTGLIDEYSSVETTISPAALEKFATFIDAVVKQ